MYLILFNVIISAWQEVMKEYEESRSRGSNNVVIYTQETPNKALESTSLILPIELLP